MQGGLVDISRLQSELLKDVNDHHLKKTSQHALLTQSRYFQNAAAASLEPYQISPTHRFPFRESIKRSVARLDYAAQSLGSARNAENATISFLPDIVLETFDNETAPQELRQMDVPMEDAVAHSVTKDASCSPASSNATQEISQAGVEEFIRSRSEISLRHERDIVNDQELEQGSGDVNESGEEMENTIIEGDSNFLDLASSFAAIPQHEEASPVQMPLTQSQGPLTQFPESQRFKTPAVAGKKRDAGGNILETPAQSRNPFANLNPSAKAVAGLSQAFENTQAASSPVANVPTSELRSDRPSPSIELEYNVQGLPTSSPIRLLSEKRSLLEPALRYVPVHQSQIYRQDSTDDIQNDNKRSQRSHDDDWDKEDSILGRQRRLRAREVRAREQLKSASSPLPPVSPDSEKSRLSAQNTNSNDTTSRFVGMKSLSSSPPRVIRSRRDNKQNDTGQATNTKNVVVVHVTGIIESDGITDQPGGVTSHRNLRSTTVIPNTTRKTERAISQSFPPIQSSPSAYQTAHNKSSTMPLLDKADHVRVANSQRSALSTQDQSGKPTATSSGDSVDMVPASPEGHLVATQPTDSVEKGGLHKHDHLRGDEDVVEDGPHSILKPATLSLEDRPSSTVPETSSYTAACKEQQRSDYETAPTNQESTNANITDWSSQPIRKTPPGQQRKRRRMEDVSQEDVIQLFTQSSSFDVNEALAIDQDPEIARTLSSPWHEDLVFPRKNLVPNHQVQATNVFMSSYNLKPGSSEHHYSSDYANHYKTHADEENRAPEEDFENAMLPDSMRSEPGGRVEKKAKWEIGDSPKPRFHPKALRQHSHFPVASRRRGEANPVHEESTKNLRGLNSTLPTIEESSPNPLARSKVVTSHAENEKALGEVLAPNMVFAYFLDKTKKYYPARCLSVSEDSKKHTIQWPGYEPENIPSSGICSLDLRVGDEVKIEHSAFPRSIHTVRGFKTIPSKLVEEEVVSDIYGHTHVQVEPKSSKSLPTKKVAKTNIIPVQHIYLDSNMWNKMNTRPFVYAQQKPVTKLSGMVTPAIRPSTPVTPSSRGENSVNDMLIHGPRKEGFFSNMAFALSFEDTDTRIRISDLVRNNGGLIIEQSFGDLLEENMQLKPRFSKIGFTALLASKHSTKEKYLQALSLGLPCLSGRWVEASVKAGNLANWQEYLLPAGESAELDGAIRSRVMPYVSAEQSKLINVISQRPKFFEQAVVIFVMGHRKAEKRRASYLSIVQIMGAAKIITVASLVAARDSLLLQDHEQMTWILVDDKDFKAAEALVQELCQEGTQKGKRHDPNSATWNKVRVADNELVKQSLIMGRLAAREIEENHD